MRLFYDCEFIEDGTTIDLISIGVVSDDGREYYAQSVEFRSYAASPWVQDNVFPHLVRCPGDVRTGWTADEHIVQQLAIHIDGRCDQPGCPWRTRQQIQDDLLGFVAAGTGKIKFVGYYSAYDHVALCQLFGTMMDLPQGWPMWTFDIKQWANDLHVARLPEQTSTEHNALSDARWNREAWHFLASRASEQVGEQVGEHAEP